MTRRLILAVALLSTVALWPLAASGVDGVTDANEASAVVSLKAISAAQMNYRLTCGNGRWAEVVPERLTISRASATNAVAGIPKDSTRCRVVPLSPPSGGITLAGRTPAAHP